MADIQLGDGDTASVVVCSEECEQAFKNDYRAERYVAELVKQAQELRR